MSYDDLPDEFDDDIMTVEKFLNACDYDFFIDYDGYGHPMKDGKINRKLNIYPSNARTTIPKDATHIVWYNR